MREYERGLCFECGVTFESTSDGEFTYCEHCRQKFLRVKTCRDCGATFTIIARRDIYDYCEPCMGRQYEEDVAEVFREMSPEELEALGTFWPIVSPKGQEIVAEIKGEKPHEDYLN